MKRNTRRKTTVAAAKKIKIDPAAVIKEQEEILKTLEERLTEHDDNRKAIQERVDEICNELRNKIDKFEEETNNLLREKFTKEDERLQNALTEIQTHMITEEDSDESKITELTELINKGRIELTKKQSYKLKKSEDYKKLADDENDLDPSLLYKLEVNVDLIEGWVDLRKPEDLSVTKTSAGRVFIKFSCSLNEEEEKNLQDNNFDDTISFQVSLDKIKEEEEDDDNNDDDEYVEKETKEIKEETKEEEEENDEPKDDAKDEDKKEENGDQKDDKENFDYREYTVRKERGKCAFSFLPDCLESGAKYNLRARMVCKNRGGEWSDSVVLDTTDFYTDCSWKESDMNVQKRFRYSLNKSNPRIVIKPSGNRYATATGTLVLPPNKITSWNIKITNIEENIRFFYGNSIFVGVAPFDIKQENYNNQNHCGWYIGCDDMRLYPSNNYRNEGKIYCFGRNSRNEFRAHKDDTIGVVMDTAKGELSFALNGVNLGVAFEDIPLDKPLVPCVILSGASASSVELILTKVKESTSKAAPTPTNIKAKSVTWNSITLTWNKVEKASFYQVEVDGSKKLCGHLANSFTIKELLPESKHTFKVRAICDNKVSKWSSIVKGTTQKETFEHSGWKESLASYRFFVDENNARIATNCGYAMSSVIGNTPLPLNKTLKWNIKTLQSKYKIIGSIYVGVAPFDIAQDNDNNYRACGWYLDFYGLILFSGPPHNYSGEKYGPEKDNDNITYEGDNVGVVMDTKKGELSFVLDEVNHGVAYEGIPLDEPLVPCAIIGKRDISVELII